jgi:hypothetical protein
MQARDLMADRSKALELNSTQPPRSLKDIARKAYGKNLVGSDFWSYMQNGSIRSSSSVDSILGIERNVERFKP